MRIVFYLLLASSLLGGCGSTKQNVRLMEEKAEYDSDIDSVDLGFSGKGQPQRRKENIKLAWRHAEDMPTGDYFWGGWISLVVEKPYWDIEVENPRPNKH